MKLLIDADTYVYRGCFLSLKTGTFSCNGETREVTVGDSEAAYGLGMAELAKISAKLGGELVVYLSDPHNCFRKGVYPEYKSNRKKQERPPGFWDVRDRFIAEVDAIVEPNLEADDLLGLNSGPGTIMVSEDKDLLTVPGKHYNPRTGESCDLSEREADEHWMSQTLTGDSTDGYPGLLGVGPVGAAAILETQYTGSVTGLVERAYLSRGHSREVFLTQARLARILRPGEYQDGKVKLWSPHESLSTTDQ